MVLGEFFFRCGGILVWDSFKQLFAEVADSNAPRASQAAKGTMVDKRGEKN